MDNQLPPALARFLSERGHLSSHVLDLGMDETPDADVWAHATKAGMILVSKDDDFVHLANRPGDAGRLIWVRIGNCRKPTLSQAFDRALPQAVAALEAGHRIVEVR